MCPVVSETVRTALHTDADTNTGTERRARNVTYKNLELCAIWRGRRKDLLDHFERLRGVISGKATIDNVDAAHAVWKGGPRGDLSLARGPALRMNRFSTLTILESSLEGEAVLNVAAALEERVAE